MLLHGEIRAHVAHRFLSKALIIPWGTVHILKTKWSLSTLPSRKGSRERCNWRSSRSSHEIRNTQSIQELCLLVNIRWCAAGHWHNIELNILCHGTRKTNPRWLVGRQKQNWDDLWHSFGHGLFPEGKENFDDLRSTTRSNYPDLLQSGLWQKTWYFLSLPPAHILLRVDSLRMAAWADLMSTGISSEPTAQHQTSDYTLCWWMSTGIVILMKTRAYSSLRSTDSIVAAQGTVGNDA